MDMVFKALADETRRKILDRLYEQGGQTLNELYEPFAKELSRQAVMKHLGILEKSNLLVVVWSGREKHHYLNPVPIHSIQDRWIRKFEKQRMSALAALKGALESNEKTESTETPERTKKLYKIKKGAKKNG